jgi:hypothetical protein
MISSLSASPFIEPKIEYRSNLKSTTENIELFQSLAKKIFNVFFRIITSPYYFVFGEKEFWMNNAPSPIHYDAFNSQNGYATVATQARKHMRDLLESLGGMIYPRQLAGGTLPGLSNIDLSNLSDDDRFACGSFYLTGREIKDLVSSLRVSYDSSILDSYELNHILIHGSSSILDHSKARGRMVSSLVVSVCDSKGEPLSRGNILFPYRVYTSNAPNLAYNDNDRKQFLNGDGTLNIEKYTQEIKRILLHFFEEAVKNGDDTVVFGGFGLGAYMPKELSPVASSCFVEAVRSVMNEQGKKFKKVIFASPCTALTSPISRISNVIVSNKSCLDIAHIGAEQGFKIALLNPGDSSGIPGQFWLQGHIALEEMFALFTTLLLAQHPHCNPLVGNASVYTPFG